MDYDARPGESKDQTQAQAPESAPAGLRSKAREAASDIDRQVPLLSMLGLGFWMAWNEIAFSGSFWLFDIENALRLENLIIVHLLASIVTMAVFVSCAPRASRAIGTLPFVWTGVAIAMLGTIGIVISRAGLFPSPVLFNGGCVLSGMGTTMLFFQGMAHIAACPPRRQLQALTLCVLTGELVFLYLYACPVDVAIAGFVLLPALSGLFYSLHRQPSPTEAIVLQTKPLSTRGLAVFLASVVVCSLALELIRSYILIGVPPTASSSSGVTSALINCLIMGAATIILLAVKGGNMSRLYTVVAALLVIILTVMSFISYRPTVFASLASCVCTCFNLVVWSMLCYIVFQAQGNATRMLALGNMALSLGTVLGGVASMAHLTSLLSDTVMRSMLLGMGLLVLVDVLFVFNERKIASLLPPLDEALLEQPASDQALGDRKGRFVKTCEALAREYGLSARETDVFVALARGCTAQEFAERESLSVYTVRAHIRAVYSKLDVHSSKELRDRVHAAL